MNIVQTYYMSLLARAGYATVLQAGEPLWQQMKQSSRFDEGVYGAQFSDSLSKWLFDPSTTSDVKFTVLTQTQNPNSSTHTLPADSNLPSGLAATLFQESSTGHKVLAFRGTEFSSGWLQDVWGADVDIAFNGAAYAQVLALYNYVNTLKAPAGAAVTQYTFERSLIAPENKPYFTVSLVGLPIYYVSLAPSSVSAVGLGLISAGEKISVTGHSLGGHLALAFSKLFPNLLEQAYVYDGAGIGNPLNPADANAFLSLFGVSQSSGFSSNITDVYAWPGPELTSTGLLGHPANRTPIFIETDGVITSHVVGELTDSLSLYVLFQTIDSSLNENYLKIDRILQATTDQDVSTNELMLHNLSKLYGIPSTGYSALIGENNFYTRYFAVLDAIRSAGNGYVVEMSSLSQNQIAVKAQDENVGMAYGYALKQLNSFAVEGLDYANFNQNDALKLYDHKTGQGTLTQGWINDRATMLAWMLESYKQNIGTEINSFTILDNWYFIDKTSNLTIIVDGIGGSDHKIVFGTEQADTINGQSNSDNLYGEGGNDVIKGFGGNDYLEGGLGNDTLDGGIGRDRLFGGAGDDELRAGKTNWMSGSKIDFAWGGTGIDRYVVNQSLTVSNDTLYAFETDEESNNIGGQLILNGQLISVLEEGPFGSYTSSVAKNYYFFVNDNAGIVHVAYGWLNNGDDVRLHNYKYASNNYGLLRIHDSSAIEEISSAPPIDPLALDLDNDGIETVGTQAGILFDHNADGIKTGTGWLQGDDGWLVLDRNGNGQIDSGQELFGVNTVLANGSTASDGFSALKAQDTNHDGIVSSADSLFKQLRIWRDLNQDGISQANELNTLSDLDIVSIGVNTANHQLVNLGNGNVQSGAGVYSRQDGTEGVTSQSLGSAVNLNLGTDHYNSQFTDSITLTSLLEA